MGFATERVGQPSDGWLDHKTTLVWMGRRAFGRRGHRFLAVVLATVVLALAAIFSAYAYVALTIGDRATAALEARLGRDVSVGEVEVGFSAIAIHDIEIAGLGRVDRVVASYEFSSLLSGSLEIGRLDAYGVDLSIARDAAGVLSVADIIERVGARGKAGGSDGSRASIGATPIGLHQVELELRDQTSGTILHLAADHLSPNREQASIEVIGGALRGESAHRRLGTLFAQSPLDAVDGMLVFDADAGLLKVDLEGRFADGPSESWRVVGRLSSSRQATLHIETTDVALGRVLSTADSRGLVLEPMKTALTAALDVEVTEATLSLSGSASVRDLAFTHRYIASRPVSGVAVVAAGNLEIDRAARSLRLAGGTIRSGDVTYSLELGGQLADPNRANPSATLSATLSVPAVKCQSLLSSIPAGLAPDLQGFELAGTMAARVELAIDWASLSTTHFDSDVLGPAGINNCRVVSAPEPVSADRLRGSFEHTVPVGDTTMTFTVGPESDDYVPLSKVSRHLTRSLMTTEDSRFYRHAGFITKEFRTALIKNLEKKRFAYGASSISMQVVKNVMLARTKTVSRKLEELFLTWYIERELPKDRILEIYVNAIEFGPGIYGIKSAARRYFNKHPRQLNPVESAFFSSILPAPVTRFKQYCRGWAGRWTKGKIDRILDIMLERNRLDVDQYLQAVDTPLIFRGPRNEICRQYEKGLIGALADNEAKKGSSL